ncbi:hypothetical protein AnigIFM63309_010864 [Aspergillus niger]|nr:hypothetical protein AnigIFM63309_010864 [Aspergillus niger]
MPPSPLYTPQDVPSFKKRRNRLPNTRAKQLLRAAERDYNDPPPPPGLGECCGSSCDPCVNDLWKEELAIWRERWGDGAVEDGGKKEDDQGDESEGCAKMKMPGSWECHIAIRLTQLLSSSLMPEELLSPVASLATGTTSTATRSESTWLSS